MSSIKPVLEERVRGYEHQNKRGNRGNSTIEGGYELQSRGTNTSTMTPLYCFQTTQEEMVNYLVVWGI